MILKALYDYYNLKKSELAQEGMEFKEIGFIIVIDRNGEFVRIEDRRDESKKSGSVFLVKQHVSRTSATAPNYLYDNSSYVLHVSAKEDKKDKVDADYASFKSLIDEAYNKEKDNYKLNALHLFYDHDYNANLNKIEQDPLWPEVKKNLNKKYSVFSFLILGDTQIVAEDRHLIDLMAPSSEENETDSGSIGVCLITGEKGPLAETTASTMIPGSQATAKLVSFQVSSGYDSYGKTKCYNAPISKHAEFAYTTALNHLLAKGSKNKFQIGNRTYVFWSSLGSEAGKQAEDGFFKMFGFKENVDDPDAETDQVLKVFKSIYSGELHVSSEEKFYILGLAPNSARISVVYWSEQLLRDFAAHILKHFSDMEIIDCRKDKYPYCGLYQILSAVTLNGKTSEIKSNLPETVTKSIFEGVPYPESLFEQCIRRIRAEQKVTITRGAIIKSYLTRLVNNNNKKIEIMLDKENKNLGYLCGRLFAVLENLQYAANGQDSIRSSYMNAASSTPSAVFPTILKLSNNHYGKLAKDKKGLANYFDNQKKEIISMINDFPRTLELGDQGRFFLGYYHQKNYKEDKETVE